MPKVPRIEDLAPAQASGFKSLICAARILRERGYNVLLANLLDEIPKRVEMTEFDLEADGVNSVRWHRQLSFHAVDAKDAGIIDRQGRRGWKLLQRGYDLLDAGNEQAFFDTYWSYRIERNARRTERQRNKKKRKQ